MLGVGAFHQWLTDSHKYTGGFKGIGDEGILHISATDLCKSPQEVRLIHEHWEELPKRSFSEGFRANVGTILHSSFENYFRENYPSAVLEERRDTEFSVENQKVYITGQVDMIYEGRLYDLKTRSTYSDGKAHKFGIQGAIYRHLLFPDLIHSNELTLVNLWHDWKENKDGPESPLTLEIVPLLSRDETLAYVTSWVQGYLHGATCSAEDRWTSETSYAVIKKGGSRAYRVFPTLAAAQVELAKHPGYTIEKRGGEPKKCKGYCPVSAFCPQYNLGVPLNDGRTGNNPSDGKHITGYTPCKL